MLLALRLPSSPSFAFVFSCKNPPRRDHVRTSWLRSLAESPRVIQIEKIFRHRVMQGVPELGCVRIGEQIGDDNSIVGYVGNLARGWLSGRCSTNACAMSWFVHKHRQQAPSMGSALRSRPPWLPLVAVPRTGQVVAQLASNALRRWRRLRRRLRRWRLPLW